MARAARWLLGGSCNKACRRSVETFATTAVSKVAPTVLGGKPLISGVEKNLIRHHRATQPSLQPRLARELLRPRPPRRSQSCEKTSGSENLRQVRDRPAPRSPHVHESSVVCHGQWSTPRAGVRHHSPYARSGSLAMQGYFQVSCSPQGRIEDRGPITCFPVYYHIKL